MTTNCGVGEKIRGPQGPRRGPRSFPPHSSCSYGSIRGQILSFQRQISPGAYTRTTSYPRGTCERAFGVHSLFCSLSHPVATNQTRSCYPSLKTQPPRNGTGIP